MNLVLYCFRIDWAVMTVLKTTAILLKCIVLLRVVLSYFYGQNKYKVRVSVYFIVITKKLISIKVRKLYQFCLLYSFFEVKID